MNQAGLPVSPNVLYNELETARSILEKWTKAVGEGIPMVDQPGSPDALESFLRTLVGELQVVSGKCDTLAEILGAAIVNDL
jgi:hypothetical protein